MAELILASASPRRSELLENAGYSFTVHAADIDESVFDCLEPERMVRSLAEAKASAVAQEHGNAVVLGSDTVVVLNGAVLGKPHGKEDAARMLRMLSGRTHSVYTGVCAVFGERKESFVSKTSVTFYELTDEQVSRYIETGEPMDKAGAYGIQGFGSTLVKEISGDYFTVMGLPVAETARLLSGFGVSGSVI